MAATDEQMGFEQDVKPLFRERDRDAMKFALDLWSHEDVAANADEILARLRDGSMPCDASWPQERIERFNAWVEAGKPA